MGLEPMTPCLKGRCSNQLSYGPVSLDTQGIRMTLCTIHEQGSPVNLALLPLTAALGQMGGLGEK